MLFVCLFFAIIYARDQMGKVERQETKIQNGELRLCHLAGKYAAFFAKKTIAAAERREVLERILTCCLLLKKTRCRANSLDERTTNHCALYLLLRVAEGDEHFAKRL